MLPVRKISRKMFPVVSAEFFEIFTSFYWFLAEVVVVVKQFARHH